MENYNCVIDQQEKENKEKLEMTKVNGLDAFGGFLLGIVVSAVIVGFAAFSLGLQTKRAIEKDMVARGFGFYTCNDKTGEVKFEYYKLEDVDVITDKVYNEKKVK